MPSSGHQSLSSRCIRTRATAVARSKREAAAARCLSLALVPRALFWSLVIAKPQENRLSQLALVRPLGESNLRHELGPDPCHVGFARRGLEGRRLRAQAPQPCAEVDEHRSGEAG